LTWQNNTRLVKQLKHIIASNEKEEKRVEMTSGKLSIAEVVARNSAVERS